MKYNLFCQNKYITRFVLYILQTNISSNSMNKELEQVKEDRIKEAVQLYLSIGLDPDNCRDDSEYYPKYSNELVEDTLVEENRSFHWTRLSGNSNFGYIVD